MNMTASSLFLSYLLWRVWELNMENVRWGEKVHAAEGHDVSGGELARTMESIPIHPNPHIILVAHRSV